MAKRNTGTILTPQYILMMTAKPICTGGNPNLYCVKLNEDMISYSGEIMELPHIEDYQEGPWFYKRNGHYYLAFASTCCPEGYRLCHE